MLITSHLFGTLVLSKVLSIEIPELYVAVLSGVAVDMDHFFVNRKWVQDASDFLRKRKITYGTKQHSWLQEFIFGTLVGIVIGVSISYISPVVRWWTFPFFLLLHIALDSVMHYEHEPFIPFSKFRYWGWLRSGTKLELLLSSVGLIVLYFFFF